MLTTSMRRVVVPRDQVLGQHVRRPAVGDHAPVVEQHHAVGVLCGEREVVHRGDEREPRLGAKRVEQLERLLLMADVERCSRLVEQDDPRLLRERTCDHDTLLLAAGQRPETPPRVAEQVEPRERLGRGPAIPQTLLGERAEVRRAAEEHVLAHRHPGRSRGLLRDDGEQPGELGPTEPGGVAAVERDGAREGHQARDRPQQRRLPRPVRADERDPLALRNVEIDVAHDRPPAELHGHPPEADRRHAAVVLVERRTSAKKGAPRNAVTTPSGISAGESAVRAITSARTRNPAPAITESGMSAR